MAEFGRRGNMVARRVVDAAGKPSGEVMWWFHCPGCDELHAYSVPRWTRTGTDDKPTFKPSLLVRSTQMSEGVAPFEFRCHLWLKDGQLQFLGDCTHELAGTTVPIPEPPPWLEGEGEIH